MARHVRILTSACGLLSASVFVCSFMLFGVLDSDFDILADFISKLGAKGQPYAFLWNALGSVS